MLGLRAASSSAARAAAIRTACTKHALATKFIGIPARRFASTQLPKSGHIEEGPNESLLFIDTLFTDPEKILQRVLQQLREDKRFKDVDPLNIAYQAVPDSLPLQIKKIIPRLREGGAYGKFTHDSKIPPPEIEDALQEYLEKHSPKPWFNPFRGVRAHLVRGRPWLEDLHRFPNKTLKVEFLPTSPGAEAAELSEETLYSLFRTYGKLGDILPQPTVSKDLPKYATLSYGSVREAIMAKNCMHGFTLPESEGGGKGGTVLKLVYKQRAKAHALRDWMMNHPRIVIPVLAALLA
ncbi:MAG: hypothetical protein Q9183_005761, partial [Haloplaca sp. 2 TL-2023]